MTSVHCEWGEQGVNRLRAATDVYVVVDVLTFSTATDVAASRGALIYPYSWMDMNSAEYAEQIGGDLAVSTRKAGLSLSPASLLETPAGTRLVLPSPNGSTLSVMTGEKTTLAGCLRNAKAVAELAAGLGERISVIAAGERWPDGSLRPGIEDWLGAGAVISYLQAERSAEAGLAVRAFESVRDDLEGVLQGCLSGQELVAKGRLRDVQLAAELNVSRCAPRKIDGAFQG